MEADLKTLEQKVTQFVELCQRLRVDNHQLRQQLASILNDNKLLEEKVSNATSRLENLLNQIPEDERMSAEPKGLQISIMGREFRVACPEEEQKGLLEAVDYLNRKMQEIRENGKVIGLERIAIMAALNIAHELLSTKVGGGFDIAEIKRRINAMETVLDQAISDQNELF